MASVCRGWPKAPFSIAATSKCRGGRYSFPNTYLNFFKNWLYSGISLNRWLSGPNEYSRVSGTKRENVNLKSWLMLLLVFGKWELCKIFFQPPKNPIESFGYKTKSKSFANFFTLASFFHVSIFCLWPTIFKVLTCLANDNTHSIYFYILNSIFCCERIRHFHFLRISMLFSSSL